MKQFFKFMFASIVGFFISFFLLCFIFFIVIAAIISSTDKAVTISENTVLLIRLDEPLHERSTDNPFASLPLEGMKYLSGLGLDDVLKDIDKAGTDPNIKGILLDLSVLQCGLATTEAIREALLDFKNSGKFVVSFADYYTQSSYYLASVSDKVFLNPQGMFEWKGIDARLMFFKGALEKLNIEMQIIRHGKFKSAVEPLISDKMSPENREQTQAFIQSFWNHMTRQLSVSRGINSETLNKLADDLAVNTPEEALAAGMVDSLLYRDGLLAWLRKSLGLKEDGKISYIGLRKYIDVPSTIKRESTKDKIAVIWANGDIVSGEGSEENIGSDRISKAIRKARTDKNVKAIVLRVNSPGGVMVASEVIWREIELTRQAKPVVASFGDYAASGGYYISCNASKIVAEPTTITGSIGVFSVIPNLQKLMNNKLGITIDETMTNKNADYLPVYKPLPDFQKALLTKDVERAYGVFTQRVADGRGLSVAAVDSIGQGRVWSGLMAMELGLVDELGGLDRAVELAAELAKIKTYKITNLPAQKDPFTQLVEQLTGDYADEAAVRAGLGEYYPYYKQLQTLKNMQGMQARLPFTFELN